MESRFSPNIDRSSQISPSIVAPVQAINEPVSSTRMEAPDGDSIMPSTRILPRSSDSDEILGGSSFSSYAQTLANLNTISLPLNPIGTHQSALSLSYDSDKIEKVDDRHLVKSASKRNESAVSETQECSTSPNSSSRSSGIEIPHPRRWPSHGVRPRYSPSRMQDELQNDDSDESLSLQDNDDESHDSEDSILRNSSRGSSGYVQRSIRGSLCRRPWSRRAKGDCFQLETKPTGVGAGLVNLGNTCFLNAILQSLTHTVPFVQHLRSHSYDMQCDCASDGFCVQCALREHVDLALASSGKSISPLKLVYNLNYFSSAFQRYQQEDAHEFLQCVLEKLDRGCSNAKHDNIVDCVFGGHLVSKLQCCNCGEHSDTYEPMLDLSLEIEDVGTLLSALDSFTRVEKIEDPEARIKCEKCDKMASKKKQLMLEQAPMVAALHLKRFKTDGSAVEKIDKHVEFQLELDLNPYTSGHQDNDHVELKYQLYAVVVHHGCSSTYGHYVCYIRTALSTWHELNDAMVSAATEEFVLSQMAYILFYAREGTPWFSEFWESQKSSLDSSSPKSVLDPMDDESALHLNSEKLGHCDSNKSVDGAEKNLTHFPSRSKQDDTWFNNEPGVPTHSCNKCGVPTHSCNKCGVDSLMVDASVPPSATDGSEPILSDDDGACSMHSFEENDCTQDLDRGVKSAGLGPSTPSKSRSLDVSHGGSSVSDFHAHGHLKVEKQLISKRPPRKSRMDSQKEEEALRYLRRMGSSTRNLMLMAAVIRGGDGPSNKKRLRSSPHNKASPRNHYRASNPLRD